MPNQIAGFHPTTDCVDGLDCSFYLMVNRIWFTKDDGTPEDDGYMNFSISMLTSSNLLENCENNPPEDGECFPRLGGWKFAFNFCLNGNYNGNGYSPIVIDRVTSAGDNTGFSAGFEYSFHNYSPNDSLSFQNPLFEGADTTQCISATITAQAFGGASSGWSLGVDYPGQTLANVRVKYKDTLDIINPDLDNNNSQFPYTGIYGMGGHPYVACYMEGGDFNSDCENTIDLAPNGSHPPPWGLQQEELDYGDYGMSSNPSVCRFRNTQGGMGPGYYCVGNGIYTGANGGVRGDGFRCRNHVYPSSNSTYFYGQTGEDNELFLHYCNNPNNDGVCDYCDANYPLSCAYEDDFAPPPPMHGEAYCIDDAYNNTPMGQANALLNNCIMGNFDCISDEWTLQYGENHPGPSYPNWTSNNMPSNIVFDIVRDNDCCSGDPDIDGNNCIEACSSEMWDINNNYISSPSLGNHAWTWLPSTWIIHHTDPPHCNNDYWTGCADEEGCCCTNPPLDDSCIAIPQWYDIFGCTAPQGCNYNPDATEDDVCDFPYGSSGYYSNFFECQRAQGCPRFIHDGDGDGLISSNFSWAKYFCSHEPKGIEGYACLTLSIDDSYPLFSTLNECNSTCSSLNDPEGFECKPVWSFGRKESLNEIAWDGWDFPGINGNSLNTDIIHTCDPNADYSDFGYNHCEARGSRVGAYPHSDYTCSHDSCFTDRYYNYGGDPYPDCEYNSWECNPNCGLDPLSDDCQHGTCKPADEINIYLDQCGVCNGNGSSCSAYGSCDQADNPLNLNQDQVACQNWGNETTWDPFDWPWGCGNSYCFSQMICPGGNKFSTDDVCYEWGAKTNQHDYCQEGNPCYWDCNDISTGLGRPHSRCGCTYPQTVNGSSYCTQYMVEQDPMARWGGQATCEGIGKVAWSSWFCENSSYVSYWLGVDFYYEDDICFMDETPYCGTIAPWNGLGCFCDAQCAYNFDCCHGAATHCGEGWQTGKIYVPSNSYPNILGGGGTAFSQLVNGEGLWPFAHTPTTTSWYHVDGFSINSTYQMEQNYGLGNNSAGMSIQQYVGGTFSESNYGSCMLNDGAQLGDFSATWIPCEHQYYYNNGCTDYTRSRYC